ncbi:MAG: type II toxin-antitoxin system HicB family antitoxin [Oscillospiraceae bacterium]|jgi:predicted RNase H-like HicB family nuclease|nr:type II toxin-antitoxin system HicB family antitoxin [Oscillospiraceae bacterium]
MAKYVYPAAFEPDDELGGFCVDFPDLDSVFTQGEDMAGAMEMAQDVLCFALYNREQRGDEIQPPSPMSEVTVPKGGFITLIACDTNYYRRYFANKLVNKTVTIPAKLNYEAEQAGVNFSQVLRNGLEQVLRKEV